MEINTPLHGFVHLWVVGALLVVGYAAIVINKVWAVKNVPDRRKTDVILLFFLLLYGAGYLYTCFFYRTPMSEVHVRLEPFWSYREAFGEGRIVRLGVARSILLNILITVPLGYFLPAIYRFTAHPYRDTFWTVLALSLLTECMQYLTKTGLCETDDVINNVLGGMIGLTGYIVADKLVKKVLG